MIEEMPRDELDARLNPNGPTIMATLLGRILAHLEYLLNNPNPSAKALQTIKRDLAAANLLIQRQI